MNNLQPMIMDDMTFEEVTVREMNQLEIYGALAYLNQLLNDWSEEVDGTRPYTLAEVDNDTYYCNKRLEINGTGFEILDIDGKRILLDCVFMIEGNNNDLWGLASTLKEETTDEFNEDERLLVRI